MPEPRQPSFRPDDLDSAQQALYRAITQGPRAQGAFRMVDDAGVLQGPFGGFLLAPAVGDALQQLGAAIRYRTGLTDRMRELAILTVAAHERSSFERHAHEAVGRAVGLTEQELRAIRDGRPVPLDDVDEIATVELTRALLDGDVDDDLWQRRAVSVGAPRVFELIALVGYYSALALQLRVLRVDRAAAQSGP